MVGCSAFGCYNRSEQGYLMKVFPKNPERRREWATKVKREGWTPTVHSYLCEVHFEPHMWEKTREDGTRKLKWNAIPTILSFSRPKYKRKPPTERYMPTQPTLNIKQVAPQRSHSANRCQFLMDVIKTEPEVDPLTVQESYDTDVEEKKSSLEEGNLQNTHVAWIKVECVDPSYDLASAVKLEDSPAPVTDSIVKFEPEEESCDEETVKEELKEEITTEEDEVFTECLDAQHNGVSQNEKSQCCSLAKEDILARSTESCVSAVKSNRGKNFDRQVHNKCHTKKTNAQSVSHKGDGSIKCNICGKTFGYVQNLRKHLLTHTGEKPFKCDVCLKCFSQSGDLIKHARKHTGERPFKCEVCAKCFSYSGNLKIHVRHHTGEKPFQCDVCGKCFSESGKLKIHVRHHTGEKPFKCDICGKCLSYSGNLKIHLRQHTGEKPFECHVCCKSFSDSGKLKIHARQHTGEKPFKCEVCGKGFAQSGNLKIHVRRHTGEKPFKCDACGKLFSQSGTLKMHIRQHTGEKPYKCDVCGKCFSETASLKKHVIQHVGETFNCDVIR